MSIITRSSTLGVTLTTGTKTLPNADTYKRRRDVTSYNIWILNEAAIGYFNAPNTNVLVTSLPKHVS
jgi:hypothetical protein